jgi:hypothetical protein
MTVRKGRRRKLLLDYLEERRGYWELKEEALDTRWFKYDRDKLWLVYTQSVRVIFEPPCSTGFGKCYGHVVRQTTEWINKLKYCIHYLITVLQQVPIWD